MSRDAMKRYDAYRSAELASVYDAVYANSNDVGFWEATASTAVEGPILELGCGTGRIVLPLARAGHAITGLDLSAHMLDVCRPKARVEPPEVRDRITVLEADMTSFRLSERFGLVFCAFGGFHHLRTAEQQLSCLEAARAHLLPGGMLVLDLINPDPGPGASLSDSEADGPTDDEATAEDHAWTDGRRVRGWATVVQQHRALQCNDCQVTYEITETDGTTRRLSETFPMRFVFRYELEHLLARTGFRLVTLYGDYDKSPFCDESLGMIAVAEPHLG